MYSSLMGVLIYVYIVKKRNTPIALLVAFGIVVPLSLLVPSYLVQLLDIRNAAMIFSLLATGPLTPFHCFEGRVGSRRRNILSSLDDEHNAQYLSIFLGQP
jgi:hypothetical protein